MRKFLLVQTTRAPRRRTGTADRPTSLRSSAPSRPPRVPGPFYFYYFYIFILFFGGGVVAQAGSRHRHRPTFWEDYHYYAFKKCCVFTLSFSCFGGKRCAVFSPQARFFFIYLFFLRRCCCWWVLVFFFLLLLLLLPPTCCSVAMTSWLGAGSPVPSLSMQGPVRALESFSRFS